MEIWKTLRVFHIPTPPTTTTDNCPTRRYTNTPLGTKNRSGHAPAGCATDCGVGWVGGTDSTAVSDCVVTGVSDGSCVSARLEFGSGSGDGLYPSTLAGRAELVATSMASLGRGI